MSFGQAIMPGGTVGSAHSSVASCRTVARSLIGNPAGSTSWRCRFGGLVDSMKVIRISVGIARHRATFLAGPGPTITPPGFTLGVGLMVPAAPPALSGVAGPPEPAVPVPATVVPQAASPTMRPAVTPPRAARLAAPGSLAIVRIATPSGRGRFRAAPSVLPPAPYRADPRGRPARPGPAPRSWSGPGRGTPAPAAQLLVRAGPAAPGLPAPTSTVPRAGWFRLSWRRALVTATARPLRRRRGGAGGDPGQPGHAAEGQRRRTRGRRAGRCRPGGARQLDEAGERSRGRLGGGRPRCRADVGAVGRRTRSGPVPGDPHPHAQASTPPAARAASLTQLNGCHNMATIQLPLWEASWVFLIASSGP